MASQTVELGFGGGDLGAANLSTTGTGTFGNLIVSGGRLRFANQSVPTLSSITGVGTGTATLVSGSGDMNGTIRLEPAGSPSTAGNVSVTFGGGAWASIPVVVVSLVDENGWADVSCVRLTAATTNGFTCRWATNNGGSLAAGSFYRFNYIVMGRT